MSNYNSNTTTKRKKGELNMKQTQNSNRILSENISVNNNTWETGINNNDLIIGVSGGGKTRGYVIPNILHTNDNLIITDTKGNLYNLYKDYLTDKGYKVLNLDFINPHSSPCGFNPLSYIRLMDTPIEGNYYNEDDISKISSAVCPVTSKDDPIWEEAGQMYLELLILYVLNHCAKSMHNLCEVFYRLSKASEEDTIQLFENEVMVHPRSSFAKKYASIKATCGSEKTIAGVIFELSTHLNKVACSNMMHLYCNNQIDFSDFLTGKTILFLNVSDNDRSKDALVNLFYTTAFQYLITEADKTPDSRLPIPVRFIMDDFSTNSFLPNFDNIISVIRSREIYVSLIIQSISQLQGRYGVYEAQTIINNCDHLLYLGSNDPETCAYFAKKASCLPDTMECLPLKHLYVFARGSKPHMDSLYNLDGDTIYTNLRQKPKSKKILSTADKEVNNYART